MRKIHLLLISILLFAQLSIPPTASAADLLSDDFYYVVNDSSSVTITGYQDSAPKQVIIPPTIDGRTVTEIGYMAFANKNLTAVTIPSGVTTINMHAFSGNKITTLDIPSTVTLINDEAFYYNSLTSVTFRGAPTTIRSSAFIGQNYDAIHSGLFGWYVDSSLTQAWNGTVSSPMTIYAASLNYQITYVSNGTTYRIYTESFNQLANDPGSPTRTGFTFDGWYTDTSYNTPWNFSSDKVRGDMNLYAKWTANNYTVTFNTNGGSTISNQTIAHGNKVTTPVATTRAGHIFAGWYKESSLTTPWNFTSDVVEGNTTLYAKWTANNYTVTFNTNGGSAVSSQTVAHNGIATRPVNPTRAGHNFVNWYKDTEFTTLWSFGSEKVTSNVTIYAKWTANNYTVTFNTNGGSTISSQTIVYGNKVTTPVAPTRAGYSFAGWYKESRLTTPWNFTSDVVEGNTTLYAKWTANNYTVTFDTNGGSTVSSQTIAHDNKVTTPEVPTRVGYKFDGWYKESNLMTPWNFSSDVVTSNMTLYAKWKANNYTVNFNTSGGSTVPSQTILHGNKVMTPVSSTRTGYSFVGWYHESSLTTPWNFTNDLVTGPTTIYAKWTANLYTVSFDSNEGSVVDDQTIAYDSRVTEPAEPTRTGYSFDGWYKEASLTTSWNFSSDVVEGNTTLYAKWIIEEYPVSFNSNGGSTIASQTIAYHTQVIPPAAAPTRMGYSFDNWYHESSLTTPWNFTNDLVTGPTTLYAKWTANLYTVSFGSNEGSAIDDQTIAYDSRVTEPAEPTRTGYSFAGWYKEASLTTPWNFSSDVVEGNTTLYAKWIIEEYPVSFNSNGGSTIASQTIAYDSSVTEPAEPTHTGYSFAGWYKEASLTTPWNFSSDMVVGNTTLYAKWTKQVYTVSFNANGGSDVSDQSILYEEFVNVPTAPKRSGYTFGGWYKEETLTTRWDFSADKIEADTTLYAKWSRVYPSAPEPEPAPIPAPAPIEPEITACSTTFSDIVNDSRSYAIQDIASRCIIQGFPDGQFKPDLSLSRAHVAIMLTRALKLDASDTNSSYIDVSINSQYYHAISQTTAAGIFGGVKGYFYPEKTLTRAEMAKVLVIAFDLKLSTDEKFKFKDVSADHWAYVYINTLQANGLAFGDDGYYRPNDPVTRAHFVLFIYRLLHRN